MGNIFNREKKIFYENGQLYVHENYKNGELEGERKQWYRHGQLHLREFYKNGERGEKKQWYNNGHIWIQENYKNGRLDGELKWWWPSGQLWVHAFYKNGKLERETIEYDRKGTLISQTFWKEGVEITKKEFYEESLSLLNDKLDEIYLKEIILSYL